MVNVITEYSDLEYTQTEISLGGTYRVTERLYTSLQGSLQIFEDDSPYVYGDQDGTAYTGTLGVGYNF